jgi:pSer/pThr/pTyr-binding forkhead associated (FHA) protein
MLQCRAIVAQLITRMADGTSLIQELEGITAIGRHPENAVVLDDETVSVYHAEIVHQNGRWVIHDLESTNGTKVNGRPITEANLQNTDKISFGNVHFRFKKHGPKH